MKFTILFAVVFSFLACSNESQSQKIELKTQLDSVAYTIGWNLGENLLRDSLMMDTKIIQNAMEGALKSGTPTLSQEQREEVMRAFSVYMQEKQQREQEIKQKEAVELGQKFLQDNKSKPGVKVTESGLQYRVDKPGNGTKPQSASTKVRVHYTGKLLNGNTFDSSVDRGEPAEFQLNQVIRGWTEGVMLMDVGSKYTFWIPSELAYGERGAGQMIGPNETLMFEVELLDIVE
jgi:FKBP-type peptidyl-prolyl cis-trans isomerase